MGRELDIPRKRSTAGRANGRWRGVSRIALLVLLAATLNRAAIACADCKWEFDTNWCYDNPAIPAGYAYCRTWTADLCLFGGTCPGGGGPTTAKVVMLEIWSIGGVPSPVGSALASATTPSEVRAAIASWTGRSEADVHLRGRGFAYALVDIVGSRGEGISINGSGFLFRAVDAGWNVNVTGCGFLSGGGIISLGTATTTSSQAFLLSLPSNSESVIVTIQPRIWLRSEVAPILRALQEQFKADTDALLELPAANLGLAKAPADCGN